MISDSSCKPDERAYSVLVRGCVNANALDEAVHAMRCAYQLSADGKDRTRAPVQRRPPVGVEREVLAEAVARLRSGGAAHSEAACRLVADLEAQHGLDVEAAALGAAPCSRGARGPEGRAVRRARCA